MASDSYKQFHNALNSKLKELQDALLTFESYLALDNRKMKQETASVVDTKLGVLVEMLAHSDLPSWVSPFREQVRAYAREGESTDTSRQILAAITKYHPQIFNQKWDYLNDDNHFPIAEKIADQAYKESKFPDLFSKLADQLEEVINSEAIDSNAAVKRLKELVKLIRKNARASFYSASYMINFGFLAMKNIVKKYGIEYLGPLGEAIQDTIKEMDEEWPSFKEQVHDRITEAYRASMPSVELLPGPFDPLQGAELLESLQQAPRRIEDLRSKKDE